MIRKICIFIALNFIILSLYSQNNTPPTPVELFFGNNRTNAQLSLNKNIKGKFNFANLTVAAADYKNTFTENEVIMMNTINYQFHKNINIGAGLRYHYKKGFIPNISMSFTHFNPTWSFILSPCFEFLPKRDIEFVGIIEFKPKLTDKIRLYSRLQGLYNHNLTDNLHDRSYANFRLGLKINRIAFGGAANIDYYGPKKIYKNNYGVFFKYDF